MSSLCLQILCSDSDSDYVTWKTTIPSGSKSFQVNSLNNMPINLTYYLNQDYLEIAHGIQSSVNKKYFEQSKNPNETYKLTERTEIPTIKINFNTTINNRYTNEQNYQGYLYAPLTMVITSAQLDEFVDSQEQYFHMTNTSNRGAICFNNASNEHTQKLSVGKYSLNINDGSDIVSSTINIINLRLDSFLYEYFIQSNGCYYRLIGIIRLYCPTINNFITTIEPFLTTTSVHSVKIRYLHGKQYNINDDSTIQEVIALPMNVQQPTMQSIINSINTYPVRMISSIPIQKSNDWDIIYTAVNRLQYYGQYVPDVLTQFSTMNYQASTQILWQPKRLTLSHNLFIQLTGALDLYDGLSENSANPVVNNASSVKFIDLETWYYKTQYDSQCSLADTPIFCPFIGNFQQYPQMLIISVSNQIQGITLQGIGGQGFSNVCYKQNLIGAPVLWGQNMLSQECMIG
ncbi:MAG: hypothetical protein EZS28_035310 [Streblomastix strix]|uniref:Uncharacterized protein n=1 Tax=Streblomastix strix TaxID=222440 RepID=A0A5J4UFY3_9EUKA|nr:MAG: hypothetical protein EZS28_035310 [Streblomastix strix]